MAKEPDETRDGIALTNLDQPLFDGADATKRDLVDYLDAVHERILLELRDRPLSVVRIRPGQPAFMQKNVALAENSIRTVQAACEYSWRTPPSRSRRRMFRPMIRSGVVIGSGTVRGGAACARA
jgi:DNA primase